MVNEFFVSLKGLEGYVPGNKGTTHEQNLVYAEARDSNNSEIAIAEMFRGNMNLIFALVTDYHSSHFYLDQHRLFSAAQEAAWKSVANWDPRSGFSLSAYMGGAINNGMRNEYRYWRMKCRDLSLTVSLDDYCHPEDLDDGRKREDILVDSISDPFEECAKSEKRALLNIAIEKLPIVQRHIIRRYYLSEEADEMTDDRLREELGINVTRACIRIYRKNALKSLKKIIGEKLNKEF